MRRRILLSNKNIAGIFLSVVPTNIQWVEVGTNTTYHISSNTDWKLI